MADPCPRCGVPSPREVAECPNCGAHLERPKAVDQLLEDLDDLTRTADKAFVEEQVRVVDEALGELEAARNGISDVAPRHADLREFVKRMEASGASVGPVGIGRLPPRNRYASPIVALGVLLAAAGVFLVRSALEEGVLALLAGLALIGIGSVLYGSRAAPQ